MPRAEVFLSTCDKTRYSSEVERVSQVKVLSVILTNDLEWQRHIDWVCSKVSFRLYLLRMLRREGVDPNDIVAIDLCGPNTPHFGVCMPSMAC